MRIRNTASKPTCNHNRPMCLAHMLTGLTILLDVPAAAHSTPSVHEKYDQELSLQLAKYSPEALDRCDRASAESIELIAAQAIVQPTDLETIAQKLATESRADGPRDIRASQVMLAGLVRALDQASSSMTGIPHVPADFEATLTSFEIRLGLPQFEPVSWAVHTLPSPQQVHDAELTRALLSSIWLSLSKLRSKGLLQKQELEVADLRTLSLASRNAERARSLVSPWCQIGQFTLAYLERLDLGLFYGRNRAIRSATVRGQKSTISISMLIADHLTAVRSVEHRVGSSQSLVADRIRLSTSRNALWRSQWVGAKGGSAR